MSAERAPRSGYRQRRRLAAKRRRRRRIVRAGVLIVLVAVISVSTYWWYGVRGTAGTQPSDAAESEASGNVAEAEAGSALLFATHDDGVAAAVFLRAREEPTMVLGLPAITLLQGSSRFQILSDLAAAEGYAAVGDGLERIIGVRPEAYGGVAWGAVVGGNGAPPDSDSGEDAAKELVEAVVSHASAWQGKADEVLSGEDIQGDADALRSVLAALGESVDRASVLPGTTVEGIDFTYFEPDVSRARALAGADPEQVDVSVEVQNGSGELGVAQAVSDVLAPRGYSMLPPANAEEFPNVEETIVYAAPDVAAEADRVRDILGIGRVVEQEGLPAGRIVVVVGKDLTSTDLPGGQRDAGNDDGA